MSDIRCQYVAKDSTTTQASMVLTDDADFDRVDPLATFMIPSGSRHDTAGTGPVSGASTSVWRAWLWSADLSTDGSTLTFQRDLLTTTGAARAAVQLIEYMGETGGPNAFVRRHKETISLISGEAQVQSSPISGISNVSDCVPIAFIRTDRNSNPLGESSVKVDLVTASGATRVQLNRGQTSGNITAIVYVVEFTGSNWSVQRVTHLFTASDTNQDETITSIDTAKSFVIPTVQTQGNPATGTAWVWLASSTALRHRCEAANNTSTVSWVITNSQLAVQRLGTPDNTKDWTATTNPEIRNVTCTTVDLTQAAVVLQAGTDDTTTNNNPCGMWGVRLSSATNVEARRGHSLGGTEYVIDVINFAGLFFGPTISAVSAIQDGATFTITGTNLKPGGVAPTVTLGGVAQTVDSSSSTSVTCTYVRGTMKYGPQNLVVTTTQGSTTRPETVDAKAGWDYVDIGQLTTTEKRVTASPDLATGDQITWESTDVTFEDDGSFVADDDLENFDFEANDGTGWGNDGTQTLIDPAQPPILNGTIPNFSAYVGIPVAINVAPYATEWSSAEIIGTLPAGLTMNLGALISGIPTTAETRSVAVRYIGEDDTTTDSASFNITVLPLPVITNTPANLVLTTRASPQTIDFKTYFTNEDSLTISPEELPLGWTFVNGVLTILPSVVGTLGPFVVTATNTAGNTSLPGFTVTVSLYVVQVRAKRTGYFGGFIRQKGDVFPLAVPTEYAPRWMEFVESPPVDWLALLEPDDESVARLIVKQPADPEQIPEPFRSLLED